MTCTPIDRGTIRSLRVQRPDGLVKDRLGPFRSTPDPMELAFRSLPFRRACASPPGPAPSFVDSATPRGGEHPAAPGHLIAPEAHQSSHHGHPGFGGHVRIDLTVDGLQVSHGRRVDVEPQASERRLVTTLSADKDTGKLLADHTVRYAARSDLLRWDSARARPFVRRAWLTGRCPYRPLIATVDATAVDVIPDGSYLPWWWSAMVSPLSWVTLR